MVKKYSKKINVTLNTININTFSCLLICHSKFNNRYNLLTINKHKDVKPNGTKFRISNKIPKKNRIL
jgi:hypothetical protein